MRLLPLTAFALLFCAPAKADKFWLVDPKAEQDAPEGSSPTLIEGVLLAEDEEGYRIRVQGGELVLPKASVVKIEKDDLTVAAIAEAEAAARPELERADEERRLALEIERRERDIRIAEAAARRTAQAVEASAGGPVRVVEASFDPVLGVATNVGTSQAELLRDAQIAWTLTKDRRYLKLLRQLRRLR